MYVPNRWLLCYTLPTRNYKHKKAYNTNIWNSFNKNGKGSPEQTTKNESSLYKAMEVNFLMQYSSIYVQSYSDWLVMHPCASGGFQPVQFVLNLQNNPGLRQQASSFTHCNIY
jgi:hypothetical protein